FGKAEVSVFIGYGRGPLLPGFPAVLQTLHEQRDGQSFDGLAILLAYAAVDDALRNQFQYYRRTVGAGGRQHAGPHIRLKIALGKEAWLSGVDGSLAGGKAVELK